MQEKSIKTPYLCQVNKRAKITWHSVTLNSVLVALFFVTRDEKIERGDGKTGRD